MVPRDVRAAAAALGVPLGSVTALEGATGASWSCGDHVLRTGTSEQVRRELLAMSAASSVVPVAEVLEAADFVGEDDEGRAVLLLRRLPGRPAADVRDVPPAAARRVGEACGRLHTVLARVAAPQGLPVVGDTGPPSAESAPAGHRLLHLDLHPFNVLVDEGGEVTGVVDWANAAAGPETLDRARTWSILTLDPASARLRRDPSREALVNGWAAAARWDEFTAEARAWACEYMLDDLAGRYDADRLSHVREERDRARAAACC